MLSATFHPVSNVSVIFCRRLFDENVGKRRMGKFTSLEICAGAGGQALGLERAGFEHKCLVEIEDAACKTLLLNRPKWNVKRMDVHEFDARSYRGIDLLAGGVPCPPFSIAGKQLGKDDERDLFPQALRLVSECAPKAVMLENVRGLLGDKFEAYRGHIQSELKALGYVSEWRLAQASSFGVSQLRPRAILIALRMEQWKFFRWPEVLTTPPRSIGELLVENMGSGGWQGAIEWRKKANGIGPTLVGGSKKHGGADLGPTRARKAWAVLGVDGRGLADSAPLPDHVGMPRLTLHMAALVQGFTPDWKFYGKKTAAYRQVGNAFPPPVAEAFGKAIIDALGHGQETRRRSKSEAEAVLS